MRVETAIIEELVPPEVRVTLLGLRTVEGDLLDAGKMVEDSATEPVNPLTLLRVMLEVEPELRLRLRLVGLALIVKSEVVEKTAVWTVSGSCTGPPLVITTQVVVPDTLLPWHPVWNPKGVPEEALVTL